MVTARRPGHGRRETRTGLLQRTFTRPPPDAPGWRAIVGVRREELSQMMWWDDGMGGGGWVVMTLIMVAFWALVILAVVALFRGIGRDGQSPAPPAARDPQQILDERFARGEISADEYHARQQVLRDSR
jgi:putative membrane protein